MADNIYFLILWALHSVYYYEIWHASPFYIDIVIR